jgi:hypothetical protein
VALSGYLLDTSVVHRLHRPTVRAAVDSRGVERLLYRCAIVEMEVLRSATSPKDYKTRQASIRGYADLPVSADVMMLALDSQARLAEKSQHRGISLADMIVAACAATHDAAVLHYDEDYDRIAEVTGQQVEWVVPAGSVD